MTQAQQKLKLIDRIYAELPNVNCKGLCHEACGPILMTRLEERRINLALAVSDQPNFGFNADLQCDLLDPTTKRCTVYAIRPLVCRLFGATPGLPCPFGCIPDRSLTQQEADAYEARVQRIGE